MNSTLDQAEIELLQQARRGAQSLVWALLFVFLVVGMYLFIGHNLTGMWAKLGGAVVCSLTAWICMLFLSGVSKYVANALLRVFSERQRALSAWERQQG